MHYRHILEFDGNAELSAIHISDGKVVVRVRSTSPEKTPEEIEANHLYPLYCSQGDKSWQVAVGSVAVPVSRNLWEMFDQLNRFGQYVVLDNTEESARRAQGRLNAILQDIGVRYRIAREGTVLKPEYLDVRSGI